MSMCLTSSSHWVSPPAQGLQTPRERKNILKSPNWTRKIPHELYLTQIIWYYLTPLPLPRQGSQHQLTAGTRRERWKNTKRTATRRKAHEMINR